MAVVRTTEGLMTNPRPSGPQTQDEDDDALLSLATILLRRRRLIGALSLGGAVLGLLTGLLSRRTYVAEATFLPQMSEPNLSGLALAASQFGVRLPTASGGGWGPPVYVEVLQSRALLEPIVRDTLVVAEEGGRPAAVVDLLRLRAPRPEELLDRGIVALRDMVKSQELKTLGAVRVRVTTRWPSVSLAIAERMVDGVQQFNLETRKSQATAERRFVESRAEEAERTLRTAEDRLQAFLQRNRIITGSPELAFERDRLQREVTLRQQVYTTLLQSQEEARAREVRDTPVITIIEVPRLPVLPAPRRSAIKAALGMLGGGLLGMVAAFLADGLARARQAGEGSAREFVRLLDQAVPRFPRRRTP